jgi:general secretion pathway protein L
MDLSFLKILNRVRQFADWWGRELRDLVPRSVKNWMAEGIAQVLIEVNGGQARLYLCRANEQEELGQFNAALDSLEDIDSLRAAISAAIATQSAKSVTTVVKLADQHTLRREVFLPLATEPTLNEVIRFEMDRLTPFKADQVAYACQVLDRLPEREKLKAELIIVRRDFLTKLLDRVSELGLSISSVYAGMGSKEAAIKPQNLLPEDLKPVMDPLWSSRNRLLAVVFAMTLFLAVTFPAYRQSVNIEHLQTEIKAISPEAKRASEKQQLLVTLLEGQEMLVNKKNRSPAKLEILRALTEFLPDNTSVSKLAINDAAVTVQGESLKASVLIEILEQINLFKNVEFGSPVTRNASTGMERYEIRLQLAGENE